MAHGRTEEEICRKIGADRLFYQRLDDLIACARKVTRRSKPSSVRFSTGTMSPATWTRAICLPYPCIAPTRPRPSGAMAMRRLDLPEHS